MPASAAWVLTGALLLPRKQGVRFRSHHEIVVVEPGNGMGPPIDRCRAPLSNNARMVILFLCNGSHLSRERHRLGEIGELESAPQPEDVVDFDQLPVGNFTKQSLYVFVLERRFSALARYARLCR